MINKDIFKAYDIRGLYPEEINEESVRQIIWGLIDFLHPESVVVGQDARQSSNFLKKTIVETFLRAGVNVFDAGFCSTPLFYFSIRQKAAGGGVMITASHNPAQYNGLKICREKAIALSGESAGFIIRDKILSGQIKPIISQNSGSLTEINLLEDFINETLKGNDFSGLKPLKVAVDAGNGMAGAEIQKLFTKIPGQLLELFFKPDGSFPNHEANPIKEETLRELKKEIIETKADLGLAFDGDGDRIVFLDEQGRSIRGDFITALLARELLRENPREKIYYEVRSSKIVPETIEQAGGKAVLGRPGHSVIKKIMRQENIFFGGELSGHYFFRQFGFVENPLYAFLLVLKILCAKGQKMSELVQPFARYHQSGEINFQVPDPEAKLLEIENKFPDAEIEKIDGLTVKYLDWWFNLRQSNTEALVRLNLEADNEKLLQEKLELIKGFLG